MQLSDSIAYTGPTRFSVPILLGEFEIVLRSADSPNQLPSPLEMPSESPSAILLAHHDFPPIRGDIFVFPDKPSIAQFLTWQHVSNIHRSLCESSKLSQDNIQFMAVEERLKTVTGNYRFDKGIVAMKLDPESHGSEEAAPSVIHNLFAKRKTMAELIYSIYILTQGIDSIAKLLMNDLSKFGAYIKNVANLKEFYDHCNSATPERQSFLICAADVAYSTVIADLKKRHVRGFKGILLYCGPHEEFYARWALQHRQISFLTHNLKELRRAVLWIMSGGTFAPNGDAVPPPVTAPKGPTVGCSRSYVPTRRIMEEKNEATIPANSIECNSTPPGFSELLSDMELPEMLIQSILGKQMGGGGTSDAVSNSNRCSTETTASNATSDATEDKLNDIAQLVALFEALRIPSSP